MDSLGASKALRPPLPAYAVRRSKRARHLQLKVSHFAEVELVVPWKCDAATAAAFVQEHADWLRRTVQQVRDQRAEQPGLDVLLPATVHLPAVGETWRVDYSPAKRRYSERFHAGNRLYIARNTGPEMRRALRDWLGTRARRRLLPWLRALSQELDLPYRSASVRAQKTRWGSCSSRHAISINRNLLFVAPAAARYLLIHELCHTVHLNHSRQYWSLVRRHCPNYREYGRMLDEAVRRIPVWACP